MLFVGASAIASYPAKAFERDSNSRQQTPVSFEVAHSKVQGDDNKPSRDVSSYNFSINYSDSRDKNDDRSDLKNDQPSDYHNSTWPQQSNRKDRTPDMVSVPEPSTLVGLMGVSALFAFKRKSLRKA